MLKTKDFQRKITVETVNGNAVWNCTYLGANDKHVFGVRFRCKTTETGSIQKKIMEKIGASEMEKAQIERELNHLMGWPCMTFMDMWIETVRWCISEGMTPEEAEEAVNLACAKWSRRIISAETFLNPGLFRQTGEE